MLTKQDNGPVLDSYLQSVELTGFWQAAKNVCRIVMWPSFRSTALFKICQLQTRTKTPHFPDSRFGSLCGIVSVKIGVFRKT